MREAVEHFRLRRSITTLVIGALLGSCATNPVTGRRELAFVSESQEIQMGQQYAAQVAQEIGVYPDSGLQRYVGAIGLRMGKASQRPGLPWSFTVMDDPQVNAFALPGGPIFVTRGILAHMNSEAELATVVGHEIGHITARHSVQQMTRQQLFQIGLVAGAVASDKVAQNLGLLSGVVGVLSLKYGRDDEIQADGLGFRYALDDGYDVRKMVDMFQILDRISSKSGARVPEWQSTHPDPGNRIERTRQRLAQVVQPLDTKRVNRAEFLRAIDGMIYGDNPRQGFFKGGSFLHPDLAFQIDFPSAWKTQNATSAVTGLSPQQDAQMQLSLAGKEDPATTMRKFLAQEGIQAGRSSSTTIHGNAAVLAPFSAASGDGKTLNALVAFVAYNGNTYQLLGITVQGAQAYDATFRTFIGSFRRLTDQAALTVKPNRLNIVRVPRAMTLTEFQRQYPSVIPIEELALINGVADGNAQLVAGESAKQVLVQ